MTSKKWLNIIDSFNTFILALVFSYAIVYYVKHIVPRVTENVIAITTIVEAILSIGVKKLCNVSKMRRTLINNTNLWLIGLYIVTYLTLFTIYFPTTAFFIVITAVIPLLGIVFFQMWQERSLSIWKGEELLQRNYRRFIYSTLGTIIGSGIILLVPVTFKIYISVLYIGITIDFLLDISTLYLLDKYIQKNDLTWCIDE